MNQFIESLYRLYKQDKITNDKLKELLTKKKITHQEYEYIISAKNV